MFLVSFERKNQGFFMLKYLVSSQGGVGGSNLPVIEEKKKLKSRIFKLYLLTPINNKRELVPFFNMRAYNTISKSDLSASLIALFRIPLSEVKWG